MDVDEVLGGPRSAQRSPKRRLRAGVPGGSSGRLPAGGGRAPIPAANRELWLGVLGP